MISEVKNVNDWHVDSLNLFALLPQLLGHIIKSTLHEPHTNYFICGPTLQVL